MYKHCLFPCDVSLIEVEDPYSEHMFVIWTYIRIKGGVSRVTNCIGLPNLLSVFL